MAGRVFVLCPVPWQQLHEGDNRDQPSSKSLWLGSDCTPPTQFPFTFLFRNRVLLHDCIEMELCSNAQPVAAWGFTKAKKAKTKGCHAASKRGRRGINEGGSSTYAGQAGGGDGRLARGAVAVLFDLGRIGWVFGLAGEASVGHVGDCLSHPDSMRRGNRRLRCR